jgi:hypothetical protein
MDLAERLTLFRRDYPTAGSPCAARRGATGAAVPPGVAVLDVALKLQPAEGEPTRTFGISLFDVRVGRTNDWAGVVRLAPII